MSFIKPQHQELYKSSLPKCKSQLGQEIFALIQNDFKRDGYFIEFGATNGLELSNTHLLEKEFGWTGILAEPAVVWQKELRENRVCNIETQCVWSKSGEILSFHESDEAVLSTVNSLRTMADGNKDYRLAGKQYDVQTISLEDLLKKYSAPKKIDYLSIDTEGSEYEILSNFNFDAYDIRAITCEHNYMPEREQIYKLLTSKGYFRVDTDKSKWDDWYTKAKPVLLYV
jgi:FkbM family methyltransferase